MTRLEQRGAVAFTFIRMAALVILLINLRATLQRDGPTGCLHKRLALRQCAKDFLLELDGTRSPLPQPCPKRSE